VKGSIATLLASRALERPSDLALIVDGGRDLTFADWGRRSSELARGLAGRGVGTGTRVALRFDAAGWADFAVAYAGVRKAGAVAVLVPAGLATADAARIVASSGALGVLAPPHLAGWSTPAWVAEPDLVEREDGPEPEGGPLEPTSLAELVHLRSPLARPRPQARTAADLAPCPPLDRPGWIVHTWAPGSLAGQLVLAQLLAGEATSAATLACFSSGSFGDLVARLGASTCGLSLGLAAALAGSGTPAPSLGSVTTVVLSGECAPSLRSQLAAACPAAVILDLGDHEPPSPSRDVDAAPAGVSQLGMLWHEQLAPGSFNLPGLVRRYRGALDVAALGRALAELVRRHEPLRTTFELVARGGGGPGQVVGPADDFALPVVDLGGLAPADRDAEAARLVDEASSRPFDLVDGPLFEPRLLRLADDDHVLVVRLHHTAFDDWSVDVFRRDLSALYPAFLDGQPPPLAELPARFVDVCRRQRARLDGESGDEQRSYWRAEMAGAPLAVQLPLGERHQIGPDRSGAGEPLRHDLPPELARSVRALAPRLRATPFMTVLAAFQVLVARRTGQDDLVLASVVAARGSTTLEPMIGCFTKKVLLRLRLGGDPTFPELVARTRGTVLGALAHQDLPFEAVVQDTLGRSAGAHGLVPQVPVVFQGETPQQARLVLPGLEVGPFEVPASARRERHFSASQASDEADRPVWGDGAYLGTFLLLSLLESGGGLALVARGVFHRPAAQRLLQDLEDLLADIARAPGRRLSELAPTGPPADDADDLALRGLRLSRSRLEGALAGCPGVAEVALAVAGPDDDPVLVAYVGTEGPEAPTLARLRRTLWAALPGSPWPAAAVVVDRSRLAPGGALPRRPDGRLDVAALPPPAAEGGGPPDPTASVLASLWGAAGTTAILPGTSYWQDFSFLGALAEARAAGLPITDEQVTRCRTPEMLAAAVGAAADS